MTVASYEIDMNKILMGVIVGLLSWNVYTTHELSISVAVLHSKVTTLESTVQRKLEAFGG